MRFLPKSSHLASVTDPLFQMYNVKEVACQTAAETCGCMELYVLWGYTAFDNVNTGSQRSMSYRNLDLYSHCTCKLVQTGEKIKGKTGYSVSLWLYVLSVSGSSRFKTKCPTPLHVQAIFSHL